mgnify:CR=1 FL=1
MSDDDLNAEFIQNDWRKADLTVGERAMLEWAEKLSNTPAMMTEDDIQGLRDAGWDDRDILDIAHVCAYFNFRVRMVDGLGLELNETTLESARAGSERAADLAAARGVVMPSDPWDIR